ncbi:MAG: DUF460 domain-containing protein [Methanobacteriaceae archaeon]|nr:DUF460 domain-containing protein [Methanobacteriaceae archaeon]
MVDKKTLQSKWIIVGFDPGITAGISILDLDGEILTTESHKNISKSEIIDLIMKYGKPVIVSTDVKNPPFMAKNIASTFNALLKTPKHDMMIDYKIQIVNEYITKINSQKTIQDDHQRDSLSAAIHTYKQYKTKFNTVEYKIKEYDLTSDEIKYIKMRVIQKININDTIEEILNPVSEESKKDIIKKDNRNHSQNSLSSLVQHQKNQIEILEEENKGLKLENNKLKEEIIKSAKQLHNLEIKYNNNILKDKKIQSKINLIKILNEKLKEANLNNDKLKEQISKNKKLIEFDKKNSVPVKIINEFTKEGIKKSSEYWQIKKDDIIYLKDSKGGGSNTAQILSNMHIKLVIIDNKLSDTAKKTFSKNRIPCFKKDDLDLKIIGEFCIVNKDVLNENIIKWKKEEEKKSIVNDTDKLEHLFNEYKAKRKHQT